MQLKKEIRRYLERELKDYEYNKNKINELRDDIIFSSASNDIGIVAKNKISDPITNKVDKLINNKTIIRIETVVKAIDKVIEGLNADQTKFYNRCFKRGQNKYTIISEMPISEATYNRYKTNIINALANELGY